MKKLSTVLLIAVGLLNFYPLIGAISADQLVQLYGIELDTLDHVVLMRHRAVLFGLLGSFMIYSAFRKSLRLLACLAGLVSMMSFVLLAYASGNVGNELRTVLVADIVGSVALAVVLVHEIRGGRNAA